MEAAAGDRGKGREKILAALLMDTSIENRNEPYRKGIAESLRDFIEQGMDPLDFVAEYRDAHCEGLQPLEMTNLDGQVISLPGDVSGKVLLLMFFSPICGSSKEALSSLNGIVRRLADIPEAEIIFVLNRPEMKAEALALFRESGIHGQIIATLNGVSAYSLLSEEPTVWIADKNGRIVYRHPGYSRGDENLYLSEVLELAG